MGQLIHHKDIIVEFVLKNSTECIYIYEITNTDQSGHHKNITVEFVSKNGTECIYIFVNSKITKTG